MCMFGLCVVCVCAHVSVGACRARGIRSHWQAWAAQHGCWKLNLSPLEEQYIFLTVEPSFQLPSIAHPKHKSKHFNVPNEIYVFWISICWTSIFFKIYRNKILIIRYFETSIFSLKLYFHSYIRTGFYLNIV